MLNSGLYIGGIFFLLCLWFFLSLSLGKDNLVFPGPDKVFSKVFSLLGEINTYRRVFSSLGRTLIGFSIAFASALIIGILAGTLPFLETILRPTILALKSAPTAAFVFLFLVLFGSKKAPVAIVILLSFPILYDAVVSGMKALDSEVKDAAINDGASWKDLTFKIRLPLALPYVLLGLSASFALSFKTEIMAEIIAGSTHPGIGMAIYAYRNADPSDLTPIFAYSLIAIFLVLLVDGLGLLAKKVIKKASN